MENFSNNPMEEGANSQKIQKMLAILLLVLALALYFLYVKPTGNVLAEKQVSYEALQSQEQVLNEQLSALEEAGKRLELDSDVKTQKVVNAIPEKLEQDSLLLNLVDIAKKNDIEFQSISFTTSGEEVNAPVKKMGISASFEGNYGDLVNFLKSIEQNGRKIVVENISVQLVGEPIQGIERVHFALSMDTFYRNGI